MQPDRKEQVRLDALRPVLEFHERDRVFTIKVIDVPQAYLGLHAGTVLVISRRALKLLSAPELQAAVAHEIGHQYFSADYDRAREATDLASLHEIELRCDAIAVLTGLALNLDADDLGRAVKKLTRFNERVGATANAASYPTIEQRESFRPGAHRRAAKRIGRQANGASFKPVNRLPHSLGRFGRGAIVPQRAPAVQNAFRVGESHLVEPSLNSVTGPAGTVRLEPKVMQVLVCLAAHAGDVVAKEHLIRTVWPDTFVTDDVLTRSISELRRVFGDDAKEPRFIQTILKSGYRLIARVSSDDAEKVVAMAGQSAGVGIAKRGRSRRCALSRNRWGQPRRPNIRARMEAGTVGDQLVGCDCGRWPGVGLAGAGPITIAVLPFEHLGAIPSASI